MSTLQDLLAKLGINDDSAPLEPIDPTAPRGADGRIPTLAAAEQERSYGPAINGHSYTAKDSYASKNSTAERDITSPEDKAFWSKTRADAMGNPHGAPHLDGVQTPLPPGWNKPPDRSATKALVAKAGGVRLGDEDPAGPRPGSVPAQVAAEVTGATQQPPGGPPPTPAADNGDDELRRAQQAAKDAEREAQYAHGMGAASDMISGGPQYNQHAGEDIRSAGQQGVKDVLARRDQARQTEDQGFQRSGEGRAQKTFADSQEMDKPGTRKAKQWEILARAKRGREAAAISPEQAQQMSANDWKEFLDAKDDPLAKPPGGAGGGGKALSAALKAMPDETGNVWAASQRIKQMVEKGGGWDKVQGVGLMQGKLPAFMLDDSSKALRQEIGNLAATHLQSKGGKAITDSEERIILGKIAANPNNSTPEELKRAMHIIERNTAGNARQHMAALPPAQRSQIYNDAAGKPGELESWANQDMTSPTGGGGTPPIPSQKKKYRMPDGRMVEASDE